MGSQFWQTPSKVWDLPPTPPISTPDQSCLIYTVNSNLITARLTSSFGVSSSTQSLLSTRQLHSANLVIHREVDDEFPKSQPQHSV